MVEIMEYVLVFAITASLAGFSVLLLQGSLPALDKTQGQSEFVQVSGAAGTAAVGGSAEVVVPLSNASIACSSGVMTFASGGLSYSSSIGYPCNFRYAGLSCVCKLTFSREAAGVGLTVTH